MTSLRCARPARDEDVQVILVGFQGDGDERSGHPSQYIYNKLFGQCIISVIHSFILLFDLVRSEVW